MARFFGRVGYVNTVRSGGVSETVSVERDFYGDVLRPTYFFRNGEQVLGEQSQQGRISVLADAELLEKAHDIRYVIWAGVAWTVTTVVIERPRLVLTLGDRYTGPLAEGVLP